MDFRQAVMQDLPQLKDMYKRIIKDMNEQNIQIWDDIYPCEFFEDDIKNNLITHNQQVSPINEIIFTHKCQEN